MSMRSRIKTRLRSFSLCLGVLGAVIGMPAPLVQAGESDKAFTWHDSPKPVPNLTFENGMGAPQSLADFRGKVVLLNIWATWCGPCRREMPTLDRLQAKLGGPDFEVVALSIDRAGIPVVKKFYEELGLKALRIYVDKTSRTTQELGVVGLPTTLLFDRSGHELGRLIGPAEWDSPAMIDVFRRHLERRADRRPSGFGGPVQASSLTNHEVIP
jgi:thiol-disulfide isomerase/thioredoxin